jgi:hypothetical protein
MGTCYSMLGDTRASQCICYYVHPSLSVSRLTYSLWIDVWDMDVEVHNDTRSESCLVCEQHKGQKEMLQTR